MNFFAKLHDAQRRNDSLLCIGLDTDWKKIPEFLHEAENPVYEYNRRIIEATCDLACAYKLNLAFYENFGEAGLYAIHRTLAFIPNHIATIADAKRGDIGNTAEKYADTYLHYFDFDAVTVNPYMGGDSLEPFLRYENKGIFILARTSNRGAGDFQNLESNGEPLYMHVVRKTLAWNVHSNCALVVGATAPQELARVRSVAPALPVLLPGIGAQGGALKESLAANGNGPIIVNASRAVIYASDGEDFDVTARAAALAIRNEINQCK